MDDNPKGMVGSGKAIETDRQRVEGYLHSLQSDFVGKVADLAEEVLRLLNTSTYAARIERDIVEMRGIAVNAHYIDRKLNPTLRARLLPFSRWGHESYGAFSQHQLEEIVSGYKPGKTK